jgi:aminoacrylate hydrolase
LIQGVGATGGAWRPQVDALKGSFRTLIFDNRGIGRSRPVRGPVSVEAMAGDARALMDAAGWESAHVVGHSMGGVIAQQLALDCPRRVRSLSLLCTFPRGKDAARLTPWVLWMSLRTRIGTRRMRRRAFLEMLSPVETLRGLGDEALDRMAAELAELIGRDLACHPPILMRQLRALSRHDTFRRLHELAGIPTWVLSAEKDPIAPPTLGCELANAIPGAVYEQFPGASHGVPIFQAGLINERLARFLRSVEPLKTHDGGR